MAKPVSVAVIPVQPAKEFFGLAELALFESFTRESFQTEFGVQADAFDPAKPVKRWFDSSADISQADNVSVYRIAGRKPDGT